MVFKRTKLHLSSALRRAARQGHAGSVTAVLAAAGSSVRFGRPKPLVEIGGRLLFEYALSAFLASDYVGEVILAVRKEDEALIREVLARRFDGEAVSVCIGAGSRDESVMRAFLAASSKTRFVAFHDAARPLIRTADIDRVIEDALRTGAATAAAPVADSLKRVRDQKIAEDVDRESLYAATTPQVFLKDIYELSRAVCRRDGFSSTDDNAYVTHAGFSVHVTEVFENPKLTWPQDLDPIRRALEDRQGDRE